MLSLSRFLIAESTTYPFLGLQLPDFLPRLCPSSASEKTLITRATIQLHVPLSYSNLRLRITFTDSDT
jgi:hypothetical protein